MKDAEMLAQELSARDHKLDELEKRLAAVEKVNHAARRGCTNHSARSLGEISGHWDAVYEAVRRESQVAPEH
jgi:hypothetical protein